MTFKKWFDDEKPMIQDFCAWDMEDAWNAAQQAMLKDVISSIDKAQDGPVAPVVNRFSEHIKRYLKQKYGLPTKESEKTIDKKDR